MAEYKNGVNFRGNMSVEADDISPEVKTGRVVFIDEDLYESNEAYKAKVDKCVEEGFMRSDEAGSGGSSGGGAEPLIINVTYNDSQSLFLMDKTFGEIRQAYNNGRTLLVAQDDSYDTTTGVHISTVLGYSYSITSGEYPSASGDVKVGDSAYTVSCNEPFTLDTLDAQYPYMGD